MVDALGLPSGVSVTGQARHKADDSGSTTAFVIDGIRTEISISDLGVLTERHYDANGVLLNSSQSATQADGSRMYTSFDGDGNILSTDVSRPRVGGGYELSSLHADGGRTTYSYDANGGMTRRDETVTNADGSSTTRSYDADGKALGITVSVTLPDGTQVDTVTRPDGSIVRETTAPDGTVVETPVAFGAQNYQADVAGAVAAWGFLNVGAPLVTSTPS